MKNMRKRGFVGVIVLIIIGVIILGYFKIDLRDVFTRPEITQNLSFAREFVVGAFNTYIRAPFEKAGSASSTALW